MKPSKTFSENGYQLVKEFIAPDSVWLISNYLEHLVRRGWKQLDCASESEPSKYKCYADPLIETYLLKKKTEIENYTGLKLYPSYSYVRIYQEEELLPSHTDRPECEISVTVNVANVGELSPISMKERDKEREWFSLSPGDAVIYKGCEVDHSRNPLKPTELTVQFMLHYVDANGPNNMLKFDKRENLGFPSILR